MAPGILDDLHTQVQSTLASKPLKEQLAYKLLDHTAVTDDYYSLAFEAAASHQLQFTSSHSASTGRNDLLISSTYNSSSHLLDLSRVDTQSRLMALALTYMKPVRTDYATASYTESFNWDQVFQVLRRLVTAERHEWKKQDFYVVIFRSKLKENINRDRLGELDDHSHEEATASGGLLKYWFGSTNEERRNLATCKHYANQRTLNGC